MGANVAGKSTPMKMMTGVYQPDPGEIHDQTSRCVPCLFTGGGVCFLKEAKDGGT